MKRPPHINGKDRICCGSKKEQCEDCPMKVWDALEQYKLAKANKKTHPETVVRLWEEYTELWHKHNQGNPIKP